MYPDVVSGRKDQLLGGIQHFTTFDKADRAARSVRETMQNADGGPSGTMPSPA
jgi:hypothetical protein